MAAECGGVGTLNAHTGSCACPFTHAGARCERLRLPACAIANGKGPEGLLWVNACYDTNSHAASILFRDGAAATAMLPVHLVCEFLAGEWHQTGLLTPADIVDVGAFLEGMEDEAILEARLPQA